ncbi:endonuclease domain-containing 1 protein-like isoform X2 [Salmo salar]|nr:endonuclease domain-containing 1 protein-like isoform X2 [Salmo salar]|eukprot:XP_014038461.1 PREDICTED: endonuclease domain-containing 1 protein-like isoform X2 [Salmo salar]
MNGKTPNITDILVDGTVKNQTRYKPICQKYKNIYRFATLYDMTKRIPVFSAYTFTGPPTDPRPHQPWMIEPQLENISHQHDMVENKSVTHNHQAADADYDKNHMNMERGHLFPCSHAPHDATMRSTFTLTNAVPQERGFNRGRWRVMECKVRKSLELNCKDNNNKIKAYVVTGAVPSSSNELNKRVNIPDLLWTAYCCYNNKMKKWMAQAHWGDNKNVMGNALNPLTLEELEGMLKNKYNGDVAVFDSKCPTKVSVLEDETGRNLESVSGKLKECDEDGCDCDCDEK